MYVRERKNQTIGTKTFPKNLIVVSIAISKRGTTSTNIEFKFCSYSGAHLCYRYSLLVVTIGLVRLKSTNA